MKIIYLLPPSEGKNIWGAFWKERLSLHFIKPLEIAIHASEKDLKCTGNRYKQGIELNKSIEKCEKLQAINRYSWVMYKAIDHSRMSLNGKKYFEDNFKILSWMYGILSPTDMIGNYKLPIETKWLYKFWETKITDTLNSLDIDYIVDFLPNSYKKMVDWKKLDKKIIRIDFFQKKDWELKKMSHGVKKIKGEYIKNICETNWTKKIFFTVILSLSNNRI